MRRFAEICGELRNIKSARDATTNSEALARQISYAPVRADLSIHTVCICAAGASGLVHVVDGADDLLHQDRSLGQQHAMKSRRTEALETLVG